MEPLAIGILLAVVNQKIIDYVLAPIRQRWPEIDLWWAIYLALAVGAVLAWLANINMFAEYVPDALAGRVLTCILVGGGSSLINDVFKR
jgi:hypothetical protein